MGRAFLGLAALLALLASDASSYVEALYPLAQVLKESDVIATGVIEKTDPKTKTCIVKVTETLKGKCVYEKIRMNIGGGQEYHPQAVMRHLVEGAPVLIFYNAECRAEIYINRFFGQFYGDAGAPPDKAWWSFTHVEIRMNRTFNGPCDQFIKVVKSVLEGREKCPEPDPKLKPLNKKTLNEMALPGEPDRPPEAVKPRDWKIPVPPDEEGFIRTWLLLGPIPLDPSVLDQSEPSLKKHFDKQWYPIGGRPAPGDKIGERAWKCLETDEYCVDLGTFGAESGQPIENSLTLGVTYIHCDRDLADLRLMTGSDDSGLWSLNGKEIKRVYAGRAVAKDQDKSAEPLTLKKGVNVLALGVSNGGGPTSACARFVNKEGAPVRDFKCTPVPPAAGK